MAANTFSIPLAALAERMKGHVDIAVRKVMLDAFTRIVQRSPVGNPELWAENASIVDQRKSFVAESMAFNEANPGKRRQATGRRAVEKRFPLKTGKGYVGGRFRANWNVSLGTGNYSYTDSTDYASANASARAQIMTMEIGGVLVIANGLPYSNKLEYGHSKQAPGGMVRLTALEISQSLNGSAR